MFASPLPALAASWSSFHESSRASRAISAIASRYASSMPLALWYSVLVHQSSGQSGWGAGFPSPFGSRRSLITYSISSFVGFHDASRSEAFLVATASCALPMMPSSRLRSVSSFQCGKFLVIHARSSSSMVGIPVGMAMVTITAVVIAVQ